ncbi:hypothetical protein CALCODRAFT_468707, partial [Calocera cornea HHB12733]
MKSILKPSIDKKELVRDLSFLLREQIRPLRKAIRQTGGDIISGITVSRLIDSLSYVEGASFHPGRGCWAGTRQKHLKDIDMWISEFDPADPMQMYWLVDVAGSGKSAIAHSVCNTASEKGQLVTSFFFDRQDANRRTSTNLITTIARDLAAVDPKIAVAMAELLQKYRWLRSANPTAQFTRLILAPSVVSLYPKDRPIVITLDGLDEGCDEECLNILTKEAPRLPGMFRFFITCRPHVDIVKVLKHVPAASKHSISIHSRENIDDLSFYMRKCLEDIATHSGRPAGWPGEHATTDLIQKAEGLFQWAAIVVKLLSGSVHQDKVLDSILNVGSPAKVQEKMDELCEIVLRMCPWQDEDFLPTYQQFMGTIVAAIQPLTISAIQHLHKDPLPTAVSVLKHTA